MKIEIREYKHGDLELILHEMDGKGSGRRQDKFKLVESSDAFCCYVAEENCKIKGFVIMEDLRDGVSHYMVQINVAEKRKGIGRKLVEKVFEKIGEGGHISLCVNSDNKEAIKFYEALGFKKSGFIEGYRKHQDKFWYSFDLCD